MAKDCDAADWRIRIPPRKRRLRTRRILMVLVVIFHLSSRQLLFSLEAILGVNLELFTRPGQLKCLDEFVVVQDSIALSCAPARGNVLDALGDEDERLIVARRPVQRVLIDEALDVKLAQDELLATAVVAEQSPILVNLAPGVLLLRRISGLVFRLQVFAVQNELVFALDLPIAGLRFGRAFPRAGKIFQRLPDFRLLSGLRQNWW